MKHETALLAGGCFWGVQAYFDQLPGVVSTVVGYAGGNIPNPTYEEVCAHTTGHAETTKIEFDPAKISYHDIVENFFRMHDPTTLNRDGPNVGDNYRSAIFYLTDDQKKIAEAVRQELVDKQLYSDPIVTEITKAGEFYRAEEYHQKYFEKTGWGACHVWPSEVDISK